MRSKWIMTSAATIVAVSCGIALAQRGGGGAGANLGGGANAGAGANVGGAGANVGGAGTNIGTAANAGTNVTGPSNGGAGANIGGGANIGPNAGVGANANAGTNREGREGRFDNGANVGADRGENWRYRFDNGRWWYWTPQNRWSYYDNGNWTEYQGQAYTANYAPDASGGTVDCTTPAGGYGAQQSSGGQTTYYQPNIDPRYRFDNGQWYYQTDNGWLAYIDGQWTQPREPLPSFIANSRGPELDRNRGVEGSREAARDREADLRGRNEPGNAAPGRNEAAPQPGVQGNGEANATPGRTESREPFNNNTSNNRNETGGQNPPTPNRNENAERR